MLTLLQIYLGALVAGLRAGLVYNTWPLIDGSFVPDVGSKITDFKDYSYRPGGIPIYNLPGRFVEAGKADGKK